LGDSESKEVYVIKSNEREGLVAKLHGLAMGLGKGMGMGIG